MLQPDAAELVGHGHQEGVVVVVTGAEQAVGLGHQMAQDADLLVRGGDIGGAVGEDIDVDRRTAAGIEVDAAIVGSREQGAVDQDVEGDGLEGRRVAVGGLDLQRGQIGRASCRERVF